MNAVYLERIFLNINIIDKIINITIIHIKVITFLFLIHVSDLSKNRFMELPEEITEFPFLEKLHLYHNAIRVIPETVTMLQSLSYLDLR
jgi:Leucine-rich repeat (LRR) protein